MNQEQLLSVVRQILLVAGGGLVTRGYLDDATLNAVAGALAILAGSAWALHARRRAGLVAATASLPDVRRIVATEALAAAVPSAKVVRGEGM